MNPLSKLIIEHADHNMKVDIVSLWNNIWKLGYSKLMIENQAMKLGLIDPPIYLKTLTGFPVVKLP